MNSIYDSPEYASKRKELEAELERLQTFYQVPEDPMRKTDQPRGKTGKKN